MNDANEQIQAPEVDVLPNDLIQELKEKGNFDENTLEALRQNPEAVQAVAQIAIQHKQESYNSPFPHPDHLERFNNLYPEAAKTIFQEFERQGEHRRTMETIIVERGTVFDLRAQMYGFLTAVILVSASIFCMYMGWDVIAGAILIFGVAPIVTSYFGKTSKKNKAKNKEENSAD